MRLLHVYSGNLWGGIERLLLNLAQTPAAGGEGNDFGGRAFEQEFALCFRGRLSAALEAAGAACHLLAPLRFRRPWSIWQARSRLRCLLRSAHFDAVLLHASWSYAALWPAVEACGLSPLWTAMDVVNGRHWLDRRVIRHPPRLVLAVSDFSGAAWRRLLPASRIETWYPPVPPPPAAAAGERAEQRRRWLTAPDSPVILMASRMEAWKGHRVLLDALAALPSALAWTAWIAGAAQRPREWDYQREMHALARQRGIAERIRWLGLRQDMPAVMAAADIFCQPNLAAEPFGLSGIEALASGLPIVAGNIGGPAEILAGADAGLLVEPRSPAALAAALERLLRDPELLARLRRNGPARARQLCDPAAQRRRLYELVSSCRG